MGVTALRCGVECELVDRGIGERCAVGTDVIVLHLPHTIPRGSQHYGVYITLQVMPYQRD